MIKVYTDGGARGNPGPAAIGVFITDQSNNKIGEISEKIGETTNNVAEYRAVISALDWLIKKRSEITGRKIYFFLDSKLVVCQITGLFKIKDAKLRNLLFIVRQKEAEFNIPISYSHIPREENKEADRLVNLALDYKA